MVVRMTRRSNRKAKTGTGIGTETETGIGIGTGTLSVKTQIGRRVSQSRVALVQVRILTATSRKNRLTGMTRIKKP